MDHQFVHQRMPFLRLTGVTIAVSIQQNIKKAVEHWENY